MTALAVLVAMAAGCHLYHPAPIAGAPPEQRDTLLAGELSPRDITGSVTAWDRAYGADSVFRPRITRYSSTGIGVRLLHAAHVAVLINTSCGPYAVVPGAELTTRMPAGEQWFPLRPYQRGACAPDFWRPLVTVVASELPMHGDVLQQRARSAHDVDELMAGRRDRWAAYVVYSSQLP
ncbi:MAG: hypothetical protein ACHQU8_05220 [Gemmatimonadales bacterium]